ncbi:MULTISPECIES: hypothetical protein [unclassified Acidovorax]|uniref:hypothetical protein n=1 Tax=unclassified Acidovorax TaxID=2684926 RepID=UPI001C4703D8|nr:MULTISPECIES: hypothetical protein [unclassified Acidovorax]MBV7428940.1 hypothetical protein [Acidovorax sp. sif0732]MBV7450766.1 hypothetical protein [Acidovorax sp. sif0715]
MAVSTTERFIATCLHGCVRACCKRTQAPLCGAGLVPGAAVPPSARGRGLECVGKLGSRPVRAGALKAWPSGTPLLPYQDARVSVARHAGA